MKSLLHAAAWRGGLLLGLLSRVGPTVGQAPVTTATTTPFDFKGRLLLSVSDADMVASAYYDGMLGPVAGADALSVIRLDKPARQWRAVEVGASNSVTGPPAAMAATSDGRYVIVTERLGPRPTGQLDSRLRDLPDGRTLTLIDLVNPDQPKVVQRLRGPERVNSVSVSADGTLVAVAFEPRDTLQTPLLLYHLGGGQLNALTTPVIPGWAVGDRLMDAEFHPTDNTLALLNASRPVLSFVRVSQAGSDVRLTGWGNSVGVEKGPFLVRFTPDGRHAVANAAYGVKDVLEGGWGAPRGSISTVRLAAEQAPDGTPRHRYVSRAETGVTPEGLCISPDGRWVVTTNLERTAFPAGNPRRGYFASLTLVRLDPQTGRLDRVRDFAFDGILPESAAFDNSSRYLAVATFDHYDNAQSGGTIDFWRIAGDYFDPTRTELVKTTYSVPVTRGVHTLVIVR